MREKLKFEQECIETKQKHQLELLEKLKVQKAGPCIALGESSISGSKSSELKITEKLTVDEKYAGLKEKHEWERLEKLNVVGGGRAPT